MASNISPATTVATSEAVYTAINAEIAEAKALLGKLQNQLAIYQEQVAMYQNQLTYSEADTTYVRGVERQIASLRRSVAGYLAFLVERTQPLTYAQTQLETATILLPTVYSQIEAVAAIVYQGMVNINTVNDGVNKAYTLLMNYNSSNNPTSGNPSALPPSSNLATTLDACLKNGLTTLQAMTNLFLELINFMMEIQALIGLTEYLSDGFQQQDKALVGIQGHLAYRFTSDRRNVATMTSLLAKAKLNVQATQATIAQVQLDLGLLNVESAAAVNSVQASGNLLGS